MAKYRKRPVVIEAVRWTGSEVEGGAPPWLAEAVNRDPHEVGSVFRRGDQVDIQTLEGRMTAQPGDWIVRGIKGEFYPVKDEIFRATYEPAEED
jgi:hypothetical protein